MKPPKTDLQIAETLIKQHGSPVKAFNIVLVVVEGLEWYLKLPDIKPSKNLESDLEQFRRVRSIIRNVISPTIPPHLTR